VIICRVEIVPDNSLAAMASINRELSVPSIQKAASITGERIAVDKMISFSRMQGS